MWCSFCSALSGCEANFAYTHHFSTLLIKIAWHDSKEIPIISTIFLIAFGLISPNSLVVAFHLYSEKDVQNVCQFL
jgi:hypothetical protein